MEESVRYTVIGLAPLAGGRGRPSAIRWWAVVDREQLRTFLADLKRVWPEAFGIRSVDEMISRILDYRGVIRLAPPILTVPDQTSWPRYVILKGSILEAAFSVWVTGKAFPRDQGPKEVS